MDRKEGVYIAYKKNGEKYFRASITFKNRHISLGSYTSMESANKAYKEAYKLAHSTLSIDDYNNNTILLFSKWITIINFRDNNIYIKTPIYMKNNYFLYYYSSNDIYLFDVDDLFYYSHHSIMKRGGHLFVAEYGMQINIAARYGIKNYAVEGRDFIFINGDNHDYRYSNIKIINRYYGVRSLKSLNSTIYSSVIHVNGDNIIGKYNNEIKAAIAYNKAVDYLLDNGLNKEYQKNFIDNISKEEYLIFYESIKLPDKILNLV